MGLNPAKKLKNLKIHEPIVGRYPLVGSVLPCGLSPLYHEYRGSTLTRPEIFIFLSLKQHF